MCLETVAVALLITSAHAQLGQTAGAQAVLAEVEAWINSEIEEARRGPSFRDCSVAWTLELHNAPAPKEMDRLRESVRGRPEHPDGARLAAYERRLAGTPETVMRQLWRASEDKWRFNQDLAPGVYIDTVVSGDVAWKLSHTTLELAIPSDGGPAGSAMASQPRMFLGELGQLLHGGIATVAESHLELRGTVTVDQGHWSAVYGTASGAAWGDFEVRITGTWDESVRRGFVAALVVTANSRVPDAIGTETTYEGWRYDNQGRRWVATSSERRLPDGRLDRRLHSLTVDCGHSFASVSQMPTSRRADPIRGELGDRRINDFSGGRLSSSALFDVEPFDPSKQGMSDAARQRLTVYEEGDAPPRSRGRLLRWLGWISASCIVAGILTLAIVRRRA